jgi:hypothetical protein
LAPAANVQNFNFCEVFYIVKNDAAFDLLCRYETQRGYLIEACPDPYKTGMNMKKIFIMSIVVAAILFFSFTAGGFEASQSTSSMPKLAIEKALPSGLKPNVPTRGEQSAQDNSIFSWTTMISLSVAVMGIVAFRRNTYN